MEIRGIWHGIQIGMTAFGGWLGWALGGLDGFLYALITFMAVDYVTGFMCAVLDKKLSSEIGFRGLFKKVMVLVMVGIANAVDQHIIGSGQTVRTAVIFFYMSNEGISILENASRIGIPIPEALKQILTQIRERGNKK